MKLRIAPIGPVNALNVCVIMVNVVIAMEVTVEAICPSIVSRSGRTALITAVITMLTGSMFPMP
ncbi:hypothetical protein PsAD37_04041 [Pseudovibrio sp. Ad37]|nr:hypothetical protein PsAD37_04041 [Pseudovibrio sp. Ad37]